MHQVNSLNFQHKNHQYFSFVKQVHLAATYLDPRFRDFLSEEEEDTAISYLKTNFSTRFGDGSSAVAAQRPAGSASAYRSKFALVPKRQRIAEQCGDLDAEIAKWKTLQLDGLSQANPFEFWCINGALFPQLSVLASNILSIPMNIAPLERTFSISTLATSGRRANLDGKNLAREVFASRNQHLSDFSSCKLL